MLSDEEKKAIERAEFLIKIDTYLEKEMLTNLLNLIEKQSKEIEELKDKCKELIFEKQELTSALLDSTPDDKIKAKIEEYENKIKKIRSKKIINEPEDTIIITRYAHYISVLQSLLEKE